MQIAEQSVSNDYFDACTARREGVPAVAILFPDCFDNWLLELGVSLTEFSQRMMGCWAFSYAQALSSAGVQTVLFCISVQVSVPVRTVHQPTGAIIYFLPPSRLYRLFSNRRSNTTPESQSPRIVESILMRTWRYLRRLVATHVDTPLSSLFEAMKREHCQVLLVQEYESARFDLCVLFGRLREVRVFGTFQGGVPNHMLLRPLRRLSMWFCSGLLIPSTSEAERVMKAYRFPRSKLSLVYSPVDRDIFYASSKEEARRSLRIPMSTKIVMYHGAISLEYKGLDVLLEAWNRLSLTLPNEDMRLIVIGTGDDSSRFSHLISTKKLKGIHWVKHWVQDRELIRRYLCSADVYVFPSRGDACPNAVIEAMACQLPIIASEVNGIPDLLQKGASSCGSLVPPADPCAVAEAMELLLADRSLARELGQRACIRARENFSIEAVGQQLSHVFLGSQQLK